MLLRGGAYTNVSDNLVASPKNKETFSVFLPALASQR